MNSDTLHEIILGILKDKNAALTISQIKDEIVKGNLWKKPSDGRYPNYDQITARISNHPELFERKKGLINLITESELEKRLLRLTWNENKWELPSGHEWKKENQNKKGFAQENQYGFGGEEWLFNTRYNIDGYQYGYIRGIWDLPNVSFIDKAYLFSIHPKTKDRLIVGTIKNIELLDVEDLPGKVKRIYANFYPFSIEELKHVRADFKSFKKSSALPIVRFEMQNVEMLSTPHIVNELKKDRKYNRFKPYKVDNALEQILEGKLNIKPFEFNPGKRANNKSKYLKKYSQKEVLVEGVHQDIIQHLEKFLSPAYTILKNNLSIEQTLFGDNIADIVCQNSDNSYSIYEVKTSYNLRCNIRDALGQLLDYSLWKAGLNIKEIVIVAPGLIEDEHRSYLKRLRKSLQITLRFLHYNPNNQTKFTEIEL